MTFRSTAAAMIVLAATTAWTQSASPAPIAPSSHPRRVAAESNVVGLSDNTRAQSATRQRAEDMGNTLTRMHVLLKQMQAKTAADSTKDPLIKANLEMWGLMLADLDKQYAQLKLAGHAREELDARRASLYKQADARAAQAAKNAQAAGAAPAGADAAAPATPPTQPAPAASSQN
jgi:hypothetical protein